MSSSRSHEFRQYAVPREDEEYRIGRQSATVGKKRKTKTTTFASVDRHMSVGANPRTTAYNRSPENTCLGLAQDDVQNEVVRHFSEDASVVSDRPLSGVSITGLTVADDRALFAGSHERENTGSCCVAELDNRAMDITEELVASQVRTSLVYPQVLSSGCNTLQMNEPSTTEMCECRDMTVLHSLASTRVTDISPHMQSGEAVEALSRSNESNSLMTTISAVPSSTPHLTSIAIQPEVVRCIVLPSYTQDLHSSMPASRNRWRPSSRSSRRLPMFSLSPLPEENSGMKECCSRESCLRCLVTVTTFRWVLLFFALVGICCILAGVALGAIHMSAPNYSYLTLSIMFIGLGVVLLVVIGIGWRCTPAGHEPCHLLFNLGGDQWMVPSRGGHSRTRQRIADRNQWLGGMIYPEFEYRVPPPSYTESIQEYNQITLQQQQYQPTSRGTSATGIVINQAPQTPPPAYHSQTGTLYSYSACSNFSNRTISQPPSYRTRDSRRPTMLQNNSLCIASVAISSPSITTTNTTAQVHVETNATTSSQLPFVYTEPRSSDSEDCRDYSVVGDNWLDVIVSREPTLDSISPLADCVFEVPTVDVTADVVVGHRQLDACVDLGLDIKDESTVITGSGGFVCDRVIPTSFGSFDHTEYSSSSDDIADSMHGSELLDATITAMEHVRPIDHDPPKNNDEASGLRTTEMPVPSDNDNSTTMD